MLSASYDNWVGLAVGTLLVALLVAVLVAPDRF